MSDGGAEHPPAEEAFGRLAHELRFEVLQELNRAEGPLTFSELHEAVGVQDSGQFNYHLGKLVGPFVRKSEHGYSLSVAGKRAVGTVFAGEFAGGYESDDGPVSAPGSCYDCDAPLQVQFGEFCLRLACSSCDSVYTEPDIPPGALAGVDREEIPGLIDRWSRRLLASLDLGICEYCDGHVEGTVCLPGEEAAPEWFDEAKATQDVRLAYNCRRCGFSTHAVLPVVALTRPALAAFYHEHGINLRNRPDWTLDLLADPGVTVTQETPLRVELSVTLDDETRVFVFDREAELVEERTPTG
jgi:hypothetical protein